MTEKPSFKRRFLLTTRPCGHADVLEEKARRDVQRVASEEGYVLISPDVPAKAEKWWQKLAVLGRLVLEWGRLFFKLHHGDLLLVQYPWHPAKAAPIARWALHFLQWKGAKTAAFIHDLDSLQVLGNDAARWSDQELLIRFDRIIVQNTRMADYLVGQGVREDAIINMNLIDHLTDEVIPERTLDMSVCVAGNLSRKRSRYLHDLPRTRLHWHLYGDGWKGKNKRADITWYGGKFAALEGSFGLCWEGMSTRTVTGAAGAYLMLTSPRKISLYLVSGMPVIVWKWSAMAEFVRENNLGLVVESIDAIPGAIAAVTAEEYAQMAASARAWGEQLRQGEMTRAALEQLG